MEVADAVDGRESGAAMLRAVAVAVEAEEVMEMDFLDAAELGLLSADPRLDTIPEPEAAGAGALLVDGPGTSSELPEGPVPPESGAVTTGPSTGLSISMAVDSTLLPVLGAFLAVVTVLLTTNGAT